MSDETKHKQRTVDAPNCRRLPYLGNLRQLPVYLLIASVRLYQITLSPFIGRSCRFQPTCSNYMIGAVQKYGFLKGVWKGICRLARCHPFCAGGYDPP